MRIRFQADNDLDHRIVVATQRFSSAVDFQSALEARLHNVPDDLVLSLAAEQGRIVV
jgi:hypothetical protein